MRSAGSLFLFFILCSFVVEPERLRCHKTFTAEQLQEDFRILVTTLHESHRDLYRVHSKQVIDQRISVIEDSIQTDRTYLEFLKFVAPLFTEIGCINTQWAHSPEYIQYRNANIPVFPLKFRIEEGKFFPENDPGLKLNFSPGTEITSINGEPVNEYLQKNYALLPVDGTIQTIQDRWLETYFPQHHSNFWSQPATFDLRLKIPDSAGYFLSVPAMLKGQLQQTQNANRIIDQSPKFSISGDLAVLTIPSFDTTGNNLFAFIDSCFSLVKKKNISKVILNLKGQDVSEEFMSACTLLSYLVKKPTSFAELVKIKGLQRLTYAQYITPHTRFVDGRVLTEVLPRKNSFRGKLYILTDGWTNKVKGFFCAIADERPETFFAGEACGASVFGMNCSPLKLTLPHTGISFTIPTAQIVAREQNYHSTQAPVVDYPLTNSAEVSVIDQLIALVRREK